MSPTQNTNTTAPETPEIDGFAQTWLHASIRGLEKTEQRLQHNTAYQRETTTHLATLLAQRLDQLVEKPNTLEIMETIQAARLAEEGIEDRSMAKLQQSQSMLENSTQSDVV